MHAASKGVTVDYKLSMEWYLKAYSNGHIGAANNVGYYYLNGKGVNQDFKLALQWFLKGADSRDDFAQSNIGFIYEKDYGIKLDKQCASEQKQLASDNENKLLKQENEILRLKSHMDTKDQTVMKESIIQNLAETFSKMVTLRVSPNVPKSFNADEDNSENDICYDG